MTEIHYMPSFKQHLTWLNPWESVISGRQTWMIFLFKVLPTQCTSRFTKQQLPTPLLWAYAMRIMVSFAQSICLNSASLVGSWPFQGYTVPCLYWCISKFVACMAVLLTSLLAVSWGWLSHGLVPMIPAQPITQWINKPPCHCVNSYLCAGRLSYGVTV